MSANFGSNTSSVNFTLLSEEVVSKNSEKLMKTEASKTDDQGEDDVFANENETNRNESVKVESSSDKSYTISSVITSTSGGGKSVAVTSTGNAQPLPESCSPATQVEIHAAAVTLATNQLLSEVGTSVGIPPVATSNGSQSLHDTSTCTSIPVSPTTTTATTRRPSYTSKAPSALINLPKTLDEIGSNPINNPSNLQTFNINGVDIIEKRNNAVTEYSQGDCIHNAKELLNLQEQASYVSLEYSNPSSSGSNDNGHSVSSNNQLVEKLKKEPKISPENILTNINNRSWEAFASAEVLTVRCRENVGELYKEKFGSGSKGKSIKLGDKWCTPIEFETLSGRASCKDWKRSIRFHGQHLQKLIEDNYLTLHAISCTCGICRGDETLNNPVKLFQSIKRKASLHSPRLKKKSFSEEYKVFRDRLGSYPVDGDVFSVAHEDGSMPPMTPLTPMTPIAPHTPFGTNCMTPLAVAPGIFRSCSPPKSVTLQVPTTQSNSSTNNTKSDSTSSTQFSNPLQTPAKIQTQSEINNQQHWIQLEEMATNLVSMANKLKLMIEQVKIQTEASKDSAVTQAKIQAESEKAEAISLVRRGQFQHIMQYTPITSAGDQASQSQQYMVQVTKVCQNCGREAHLECTGCYRSSYCGQFCQQKDWQTHKAKCREIAGEEANQNSSDQNQISSEE